MIDVDLPARLPFASVLKTDAADLTVHPDAPLNEPADEVDAGDGEAVDWMEGVEHVEGEVEDGLEDGEERHEGGVDKYFAGSVLAGCLNAFMDRDAQARWGDEGMWVLEREDRVMARAKTYPLLGRGRM